MGFLMKAVMSQIATPTQIRSAELYSRIFCARAAVRWGARMDPMKGRVVMVLLDWADRV